MTKEELLKQLEEEKESVEKIRYKTAGIVDGSRFLGRLIELERVIDLAEKLDEPKKVVIPQFVADWIEEAKIYYVDEVDPLRIIFWIGDYISDADSHYEWLKNIHNQELLFNAIANGYEVEKEKKYLVKIKGFDINRYLNNYNDGMEFKLGSSKDSYETRTHFTKQWIKDNWAGFNTYNNAGLLEFEEVEDD
jgi:hypothetical protein